MANNEKFVEIDLTKPTPQVAATQDEAVAFSIKLIDLLKKKSKEYSLDNSPRVSCAQLKKVYSNAVESYEESSSCPRGEWALARVNMFLEIAKGQDWASFKKNKNQVIDLDFSEGLTPSEENFSLAKLEIEANKLNFDYKSLDDLYLDQADFRFWFEL